MRIRRKREKHRPCHGSAKAALPSETMRLPGRVGWVTQAIWRKQKHAVQEIRSQFIERF
jgi:hypothetical protein